MGEVYLILFQIAHLSFMFFQNAPFSISPLETGNFETKVTGQKKKIN